MQRRMLPAFAVAQQAQLKAIASRRPGAAREAVSDAAVTSYDSYEDLLADSEIDAVYIPAAGDEHRPWTLAAAAAGKHVLCEKPLALNLDEAQELQTACREAGVLLMEAFMWRHHPRSQRLHELVFSGQIGDLRLINVSFSFDIDRSDWRLDPARGGGAVWDLGCYGVNCARFLTGKEPENVYSRTVRWKSGADMTTQVALRFPSNVLANIDCSFEAPFRCRVEVVGTGGQIVLNRAFQNEPGCTIDSQPSASRDTPWETIEIPTADQYACQLDHFANSVTAGKLLPPAEDGVANMRIMQQIVSQW